MVSTSNPNVMQDLQGYVDPQQVVAMIGAAQNNRDRMLIKFCWRTGRRISEVLEVKKKHIDFHKGLILFHILKKRNKEYYKMKPVDAEFLKELYKYTQNKDDDSFLFPSPYKPNKHISRKQAYNIIRRAAEDAGIFYVGNKPMHPHVLRHSFAVHFLRNAKNVSLALKILQMQLEHYSLDMTSNYLQFTQDELRKQLNEIFSGEEE